MRHIVSFCAALAGAILPAPLLARPLVAVIDSGVARTAELQAVVVAEFDMASDVPRETFRPRYDHGTMVATILHREAKGAVDIVSIRIDDPAGCPRGANPPCQPSARPIADAIRKATDLGVDAINISLSLSDDAEIVDAVGEAAAEGIEVILAAGNDGLSRPGNLSMARAGFPNAVLVGAVDAKGAPWRGTNRPDGGRGYDYVWRFGVNVPTIAANGGRVLATGTSFAVPIETARRMTRSPVMLASSGAEAAPAGGALR